MPKVSAKHCTKCKKNLPCSNDYFPRNKATYDKLGSWCKKCCSEYRIKKDAELNATLPGRAKLLKARKKYHEKFRKANPGYLWKRSLMKRFGFTLDDYEIEFNRFGGVCIACGNPESRVTMKGETKKLAILATVTTDETGKKNSIVHGLFCGRCVFFGRMKRMKNFLGI